MLIYVIAMGLLSDGVKVRKDRSEETRQMTEDEFVLMSADKERVK